MDLKPGDNLGPYHIDSAIGRGGMGEVWKARDSRLNRDVAIKTSQVGFSGRFQNEAQAVAALNHPNICTLYDVGPDYLVMEFIEGTTLAERIARGPIPLEEALGLATQIANALEAAHDRGIVHRDLKPANIKIRPDGSVKVLDFGLARTGAASDVTADSPTLLTMGTQAGVILGTAGYMSPEQARGQVVDKRADIWAFGVVLHEMLTGTKLFEGATLSDSLAAILKEEPDLAKTPARVRRLLARCLEKDPNKRLRGIGDWRELLADPATPTAAARTGRAGWAAAAIAIVALGALSIAHFRETPPLVRALRAEFTFPDGSAVQSFALSPDGSTVVIAMTNGKPPRQLWLRRMDSEELQPIAGTEDGGFPFWSPDGGSLGFFANGKLKKVSMGGGLPQSVCDAPDPIGGSWGADDRIIFSPSRLDKLHVVSAGGGVPVQLDNTLRYRFPRFLPDGRHFLAVARFSEPGGIVVGAVDGGETRQLLPDRSTAVFAPNGSTGQGHVLFSRDGILMALPFDATTLQGTGSPFPLAKLAGGGDDLRASAAADGTLLYQDSDDTGLSQMEWIGRAGTSLGTLGEPGGVFEPVISPDGSLVAYRRDVGNGGDLWIRDVNRGTESRFTRTENSRDVSPVWAPDGARIAFTKGSRVYIKGAGGGDSPEQELTDGAPIVTQWSRDGRFLVYQSSANRNDIMVLPLQGPEGKPFAAVQSESTEIYGQLSPDSRWMAFASDRTGPGRFEIYVRPFPPGEGEWTVSTAGGTQPRWRADGRELFYIAGDGTLMAVPVRSTAGPKATFDAGTPARLFDARVRPNFGPMEYDVSDDGQRFLIARRIERAKSSTVLTVIANWYAGVKR